MRVFYSILFYFTFILFYSILFYSILFYSILFYSILFYSILFYSILFYSILFYSILLLILVYFHYFYFYSILFYSTASKAAEKNDLSPPQTATDDLLRLVKPHLPNATELPEFFWHHLERDLQLLGQATGKSVDEAAIILHLVLRGILTQEPPKGITLLNFV